MPEFLRLVGLGMYTFHIYAFLQQQSVPVVLPFFLSLLQHRPEQIKCTARQQIITNGTHSAKGASNHFYDSVIPGEGVKCIFFI